MYIPPPPYYLRAHHRAHIQTAARAHGATSSAYAARRAARRRPPLACGTASPSPADGGSMAECAPRYLEFSGVGTERADMDTQGGVIISIIDLLHVVRGVTYG